jgi:DNA helicase-2/ATP-dependent DNA helicase PcrA
MSLTGTPSSCSRLASSQYSLLYFAHEQFSEFKQWSACKKSETDYRLKDANLKKVFAPAYREFEKERLKRRISATEEWVPDLVNKLTQSTVLLPSYKYVVVDEYQDINAPQNVLFVGLAKKGASIMCVGDEDQTIYSWRGSAPRFIKEEVFSSQFTTLAFYQITRTFRFGHAIALVANSLISNNKEHTDKLCIADKATPE